MVTTLRRFGALAATLGTLLLVASCRKDEAAPPAPATSWQVDGQAQQAKNVTLEFGTPSNNPNTLTISIWQSTTTATSNGSAVALILRVPNRAGTYNLPGTNTDVGASYSDYVSPGQGSNVYLATGGSITIATLTSNSVAGTFSFTGAELSNAQHTKRITNGQFSASF